MKKQRVPSYNLKTPAQRRESGVIVNSDDRERRILSEPITYREAEDGTGTVTGYAAVFNKEITIGGWFREQIAPGAFTDALKRPDDVRALFNHDPNELLGRTSNKTLRLTQDARGLRYEIDLPDTSKAQDVRKLIQRGDVDGSSFGFIVDGVQVSDANDDQKLPLRTVTSVELFDVSPVTYPAYPQTSVQARDAMTAARETETANTLNLDVSAREAARARIDAAQAWTPPQ